MTCGSQDFDEESKQVKTSSPMRHSHNSEVSGSFVLRGGQELDFDDWLLELAGLRAHPVPKAVLL